MKIRVDFLVAIAAEHRFVEAQLIGDVEVLDDEYLYQIVQCDGRLHHGVALGAGGRLLGFALCRGLPSIRLGNKLLLIGYRD